MPSFTHPSSKTPARLSTYAYATHKRRKHRLLTCDAAVHTVRRLAEAPLHRLPGGELIAPLLGPDTHDTLPFAIALELSPHSPTPQHNAAHAPLTPTYALHYILEGRGEVCFGRLAQHSQRVQAGDTVLAPTGAGQYIPQPSTNTAQGSSADAAAVVNTEAQGDDAAEGDVKELPGQLARLVMLFPEELFDQDIAADIGAHMRSYPAVEDVWATWKRQPTAGCLSAEVAFLPGGLHCVCAAYSWKEGPTHSCRLYSRLDVVALLSRRQRPLPPGTSPPPPHVVSCSMPITYPILPSPHANSIINSATPTFSHTASSPSFEPHHLAEHQPDHTHKSNAVRQPPSDALLVSAHGSQPMEHRVAVQQPTQSSSAAADSASSWQNLIPHISGYSAPWGPASPQVGPGGYLGGLVHVHDQLVAASHSLLRQAFPAAAQDHALQMLNATEHMEADKQLTQGGQQYAQAAQPADAAHTQQVVNSQTGSNGVGGQRHDGQTDGQAGAGDGPLVLKRALDDLDTFQLPNQSNMLAIVFDPHQHAVPFTFGIEVFQSGHRTPPHVHTHAHEVFFVLAGEGEGFCNGVRFPISAGDLLLFPPKCVHGINVSESGKMFCLEFMLPNQQFVEMVRRGQVAQLNAEELCQLNVIAC